MYIKVRVSTGVKKESFKKVKEDTYEVAVREKAEMNLANRRVTDLLSETLGIPPSKIRLVSGHHSPSKIFSIVD